MSKIKKFRKNDWSDDGDDFYQEDRRKSKDKRLNRAVRTRDIDYLSNYYDEDEYE